MLKMKFFIPYLTQADIYLMHAQGTDNFAYFKKCHAYETALDLMAEGIFISVNCWLMWQESLKIINGDMPMAGYTFLENFVTSSSA